MPRSKIDPDSSPDVKPARSYAVANARKAARSVVIDFMLATDDEKPAAGLAVAKATKALLDALEA